MTQSNSLDKIANQQQQIENSEIMFNNLNDSYDSSEVFLTNSLPVFESNYFSTEKYLTKSTVQRYFYFFHVILFFLN